MIGIDVVTDLVLFHPLSKNFPCLVMFQYPALDIPWLRVVDLSLGLALVAYSEELVFRRISVGLFERMGFSTLMVMIVASAIFALMHWGGGAGRIATTFVMGLAFCAIYRRWRSRSLWMVVLVHYFVDLQAFWYLLIPESHPAMRRR